MPPCGMTPTDSEAMAMLELLYSAAKIFTQKRQSPVHRERLEYAVGEAKSFIDATKEKKTITRMARGKTRV
jgi:hypothetical protein